MRASRPCSAPALPVLRRLSHRPGQARRIAACGPRAALEGPPAALTPTALGRYRLPLLAPPHGTRARASPACECVGQDRAARHCAAALRRLRATAQSRYLVNHRPQTSRPALAPGTASPGLSNARLTQTPRWCTSLPRPRVCAPKRAARYCDAAPSTALRRLRAAARAAPQNRFCGQRAAVEAFGFRSAFGKAGSHSQRSACVSQSAEALSPKDTARFASC